MQLRLAVDFPTRDDIVVTASLNEKKNDQKTSRTIRRLTLDSYLLWKLTGNFTPRQLSNLATEILSSPSVKCFILTTNKLQN